MRYKIEFEDHGQDFLTWVIDTEKRQVVDCGPFQASIWVGTEVLQTEFEVGGEVVVAFKDSHIGPIKYPIKSVEVLQDNNPKNNP